MARTVLQIDGMSCGHCVATLTRALRKLNGVSGVNVSLEEKRAVVEHLHDGTPTLTDMVIAVEEEGYSARISG